MDANDKTTQQKLLDYISDLEDVPLSIHRMWKDFHTNTNAILNEEKVNFIHTFLHLHKIYSSFRLVYNKGIPYILNTKRDLWQFKDDDFLSHDENKITNGDILKGLLKEDDDLGIHNSFVCKVIQNNELNNLKLILEYFSFTEQDLDDFLQVVMKENQNIEMIVILLSKKYQIAKHELIVNKNSSEIQLNIRLKELKLRYNKLELDYDNLNFNHQFTKFICIPIISVLFLTHLFF